LLSDDDKRICAGVQRRAHLTAATPHIIDRDVHLPEGTVIGYDPAKDKRHYHVTPSGLTVVTRDHSLYDSPVNSDFMNGPR
jgi:ADP-glucose pyrophosphorylase